MFTDCHMSEYRKEGCLTAASESGDLYCCILVGGPDCMIITFALSQCLETIVQAPV